MKYEVSTDIQFVQTDDIEVPNMIICLPAWRILRIYDLPKEDHLKILWKEPTPDSNSTTWIPHDYDNQTSAGRESLEIKLFKGVFDWIPIFSIIDNMRNYSIADQFDYLTAGFGEIFGYFEIFVDEFTDGNTTYSKELYYTGKTRFSKTIHLLLDIKQYMRDINKCFSMELRGDYKKLKLKDVLRQPIYQGSLIQVGIRNTIAFYTDLLMFGVTIKDDPYSTSSMYSIHLHIHKNQIVFSFDEYQSKLLAKPYQTDCRNYTQDGFVSQGDCHETCVKKMVFLNKTSPNVIPISVTIKPEDTFPLAPASTFSLERDKHDMESTILKDKIQSVLSFCDKECSQRECESQKMLPRLLSLQTKRHNQYIALFAPINPKVVVVSLAKYSFIEFITALFSTLGFWLGISVFGSIFDAKTAEKVLVDTTLELKRRTSNKLIRFSPVPQRSAPLKKQRNKTIIRSKSF